MAIFTPPMNIGTRLRNKPSIFLAGSIDMGLAENWRLRFSQKLDRKYNVFNPRRSDWDPTWSNDYENPQFYQQVNWELNALESSDIILFNFLPESKSPITLMELGAFGINESRVQIPVVLCPKGYEKKGNVDIFCDRYNITLYDREDLLLTDLENMYYKLLTS